MSFKLTPTRIIFLGFAFLILIGAILLMAPISSYNNISFIDALFTATSATCVTGLSLFDTNTTFSFWGQLILIILIQIGGLGIMSIFTLFAILTKKQLNLTEKLTISESINEFNLSNVFKIFVRILCVTMFFELLGTLLLFTKFQPIYGNLHGFWKSIFLSVSAFCNAGFDILGTAETPFQNLTLFTNEPVVLLTIASLFIIGGLGFIVWKDIWNNKLKFNSYILHSKIVLIVTIILLLFGSILFYIFEANNTLANMTPFDSIISSFFSAATPRTAGFNSINTYLLNPETKLLLIILMFIGGAPGSTAGGIKITTFTVLILASIFFIKGREDIQIMKNSVSKSIIFKSICIFMLAMFIILIGTMVLLINNDITLLDALFEVTSAFSTTGLSTGITPLLNNTSKVTLSVIMFLGRLGPLTTIIAFSHKQGIYQPSYKYSEGKIMVG